jgi:peroxiredoxin
MATLSVGDAFPDIKLDTREGDVALSERWRNGPLVVAFMRHFGCAECTVSHHFCLPPLLVRAGVRAA